MPAPLLILSPDGSFDRAGAVTPTVVGSMPVVAGQYGSAWQGGSGYLSLPTGYLVAGVGTVLIRAKSGAAGAGGRAFAHFAGTPAQRIYLDLVATARTPRITYGDPQMIGTLGGTWSDETWGLIGARWIGKIATLLTHLGTTAVTGTALTTVGGFHVGAQSGTAYWAGLIESVLIYGVALSDAEVARISAVPAAWTMQNTTASVPGIAPGLLLPV